MKNLGQRLIFPLLLAGCVIGPKAWAEDAISSDMADQTEAMSAESNPLETPSEMPASPSDVPAASSEGAPYTIIKGDTLWDLSGKFYQDPWLWKRIWQANPYVVNPDLIYYDKTLVIPGAPTTASQEDQAMEQQAQTEQAPASAEPSQEAPAAEEPSSEEAMAQPVEETTSSQTESEQTASAVPSLSELSQTGSERRLFSGDSFVAPRDWEFDGFITAERDQKLMVSAGDIVYLDMGSQQGIAPKTQCLVYRKGRRVFHPSSGEFLGYVVRKVALIEVNNEVVDQAAAADVLISYEPVAVGDLVRILPERYKK